MADKNIVICVAIAALVILETVALCKGINGALFAGVIAVIAGLAGYTIPSLLKK